MLYNALLSSILLASAANAGPIEWLTGRAGGDPDLSKLPSVKDKITLYRGVSNPDELKATRGNEGKNPTFTNDKPGDFNAAGTPALYFWSEEELAELWCETRDHSKSKDITECAVVAYEWVPPEGTRVKRWNQGDTEYENFVEQNWLQAFILPIQRENDWIEGPLSNKIGGKYQASYMGDIQHALVNKDMLKGLTIKSVGEAIKCQGARRQTCGAQTPRARPLLETTMAQFYEEAGSSDNGGAPAPEDPPAHTPPGDAASVCSGYEFAVLALGADPSTGAKAYSIVDNACDEKAGEITPDPCTSGTFECSQNPLHISKMKLQGQDYTCEPNPNAGKCAGGGVLEVCCKK